MVQSLTGLVVYKEDSFYIVDRQNRHRKIDDIFLSNRGQEVSIFFSYFKDHSTPGDFYCLKERCEICSQQKDPNFIWSFFSKGFLTKIDSFVYKVGDNLLDLKFAKDHYCRILIVPQLPEKTMVTTDALEKVDTCLMILESLNQILKRPQNE